ncbi:hypothetical protein [Staphylothermus hellenicus]|uniref:Uncharacterized protein n=1 Tax=Staphylothermus hellenicus (strain DSM 12710 / JCM 10830 / BK20S6-10-b1 / P8) TaxID=591019 RepID=D7D9V0_STAHD|nr:hypothetical protein [Staphylothermus hellenicus]ADI32546.1 hypothetical protein Shell_1458 [Staphylothermus hellenicus DSM 12710]
MSEISIVIDLAKSPHVQLSWKKAIELLECIGENTSITRDLEEALRIIRNFEEFYRFSRKRFEEYIAPPKEQRDVILGRVVVHKIKLFKKDSENNVEIVFDRRFSVDKVISCLKKIGYSSVDIHKQFI